LHTNVRYVSAKDRPGYEIDARSARTELTYGGTVELRALSNTFVGVTYAEAGTKFDSTATFLNVNLHDELTHESTTRGLAIRHQLTPLTAIIVNASQITERFDYSSLRNSDSNQVSATVNFDPLALIKGSATVGYRDFKPLSNLPGYRGPTASVNLSYAMLGTTRFVIGATRDVQYSYDDAQPYYLQTGLHGSVAQQIFGPFDVVARAGWQNLAYRDRPDAQIDVRDRTDEVHTYGAGAGFHMGKDLRLGFNVDHSSRTSKVALRQYQDLTFGSQITYGVP